MSKDTFLQDVLEAVNELISNAMKPKAYASGTKPQFAVIGSAVLNLVQVVAVATSDIANERHLTFHMTTGVMIRTTIAEAAATLGVSRTKEIAEDRDERFDSKLLKGAMREALIQIDLTSRPDTTDQEDIRALWNNMDAAGVEKAGEHLVNYMDAIVGVLAQVEASCRDDLDYEEILREWGLLDAEGVLARGVELAAYVTGLRQENQTTSAKPPKASFDAE